MDLKAEKGSQWKDKWQQADNLRQTLQQKLSEASSIYEGKPDRRPVKFQRSLSEVRLARACEQRCITPADLETRHVQNPSDGKPLKRGASKTWHQVALMSKSSKKTTPGE